MIDQVTQTLFKIFLECGKLTDEEASDFLLELRNIGRIQIDNWGVIYHYPETIKEMEVYNEKIVINWLSKLFIQQKRVNII